jgi:sugar-specific transcriptional regulator TrmB
MDNYHHIFETLGFTQNETKVYLMLVRNKQSTVQEIAKLTSIHRRNIYDVLQRLIEKGCVCEIITQNKPVYKAFEPKKIESSYIEKVQQLQNAIPYLQNIYEKQNQQNDSQEIILFRGFEGYKNYMRMIISIQETVYSLGTKGDWFDPQIKEYQEEFFRDKKRLNIKSKLLLDYEYANLFSEKSHAISEYKILPKKYSTSSTIDCFGDYIVIFNNVKSTMIDPYSDIIMIKNKKLTQNMVCWHQLIWDLLK